MLFILAVNILIVSCFLIAGAAALIRDSKAPLNRLFFLFLATMSTWIIANFFSNNFDISYDAAMVANHITLLASGMVLMLLICFSLILSKRRVTSKWIVYVLASGIVYALSATPLMFNSIEQQGTVYAINFTSLANVYFAVIFINIISVLSILLQARKRAKGQEKSRLNALFWGVAILLSVNVATNALLPAVGNLYALTNVGPLSGIFVIYALWLSIVKHRLFDIRLLIARSLTYLLSLMTITILFIGGTFTFVGLLFNGSEVDANALRWIYTGLAIALALTFQPLKRVFDRLSNRYFYKDAYNAEAFLADVNKTVVSNVDVDILLKDVSEVIASNLKTEFAVFELHKTSYVDRRIIGKDGGKLDEQRIDTINAFMLDRTERILTSYDVESLRPDIFSIMQADDIKVVSKLNPFAELNSAGYGALLIGPKKSGYEFTKQDLNIIRIITVELSIAVQNALRFEEIEKFNVTLQEKVNEATRKLRNTNEKLEAMDETKDEFISMASHQLRTPLTSVKGYVSMVLEGDAGELNAMQRKLLEQAFTSSQRMVFLIADLLNLSRLRTGKFIIETAPTNLADVIEGEVAQLKETAESRSLKLKYTKPKNFSSLMLDETKIRQVIMNFVDNAIYYTPAGGVIEIRLTETDKSVEFTVRDNGIGVPKAEQHHLFNKFYRARNAQKARPDGTGLGLFMAKKVIVAQGGAIVFNSSEGKGSIFGFTFSKDKLHVPSTES